MILNPYRFGGGSVGTVVSLCHFDGTDGSTTITDETGIAWTVSGNAQLDTAIAKFGSAALLLDGSGDFITSTDASLALGTSNFTIEFFAYRAAQGVHNIVSYDSNNAIYCNSGSDDLIFQTGGVNRITIVGGLPITSWTHIAVCRAANVFKMFTNGIGSSTSAVVHNYTTARVDIGQRNGSTNRFNGSIDELRITKGLARYSSDFTPPAAPFPYP